MRSHGRRWVTLASCAGLALGVLAAMRPSLLLGAEVVPRPREVSVELEAFGKVAVFAPRQGTEPLAFIVYLSDDRGDAPSDAPSNPAGSAGSQLTAERRASVERLVARGAVVAPLSARSVLDRLAAMAEPDATCLYPLGEFEELSTVAQRALGGVRYRWPVLLGDGVTGGTLAYLALAQAPANTAAGAVSLAFSPALASKLPLCAGALWQATPGNEQFRYIPSADVPGRWVLVAPEPPSPEVDAFLRADDGNELRLVPGGADGADGRLRAAEAAAIEVGAPPATSLGDLPLVELPARGPDAGPNVKPTALAVFISGDGGWRDIDKQIAEQLTGQGVAVVGIDALRYFWRRKSPETLARDLERIIAAYGQRWQTRRVALLGFSLGADALPLAWAQLGPAARDQVRLIGLIALGTNADLEVSVSGFLGIASGQATDLRAALRTLPSDRVLCFFGTQEKAAGETGCLLPELAGATLVERPGGHHLNSEYRPVAQAILARLR